MPLQRIIDYLNQPDELLKTWQALLLGALKIVLLVAVTVSLHAIMKEEILASIVRTKAEIRLLQQTDAIFQTADGPAKKRLLSYELSASDTVTGVAVEIDFGEGTEILEYGVSYSDGIEGGVEQRLLEKNRVSFALQHDLKKNRRARIDLLISKRVSGSREATEPGKMPEVQAMGKDRHGDVRLTLTEELAGE